MKRFAKAVSAAVCTALLFGAAACSPGESGEVYEPYDYTAKHLSIDNVLRFYSSDNRLDAFMNEYFERHMRYDEDMRIHTFPVGGGQPVWKGRLLRHQPLDPRLARARLYVRTGQAGVYFHLHGHHDGRLGAGVVFPFLSAQPRRQLRGGICIGYRRLDGRGRYHRFVRDGRRRRRPAVERRGRVSESGNVCFFRRDRHPLARNF